MSSKEYHKPWTELSLEDVYSLLLDRIRPSRKRKRRILQEETAQTQRTVYFNINPADAEKDQNGKPKTSYPSNKIRTAKYTALTFVPEDLWLQFHNVANIYFLFVVILNVRNHPLTTGNLYVSLSTHTVDLVFCDIWCQQPSTECRAAHRHSCSDRFQRWS